MKSVYNWKDMEQFGIHILTGEACGAGLRVLCDLDKRGKALIADFFGFDPSVLAENWNSGGERSIMLPYSILHDLAVFALLRWGCPLVVSFQDRTDIHGAVVEEEVEQIKRIAADADHRPKVDCVYRATGTAPGGLRNVHEASGRIA